MSANGYRGELCMREARLVALYPWIAWTEPQPVQVEGISRLTCRLCTALDGLRGVDVLDGSAGFADRGAFESHLIQEHTR